MNLRVSVLGCWLLCVMLIASSALKACNPFPATSSLEWTGLSSASRLALVDVLSAIELFTGVVLFVGFKYRAVQYLACAIAGSLAIGHGLSLTLGRGDCGCFGGVAVPDWITLTVLAIGFLGALNLSRRLPRNVLTRRVSLMCAGLAVAAVATMIWTHRARAPEPLRPTAALLSAAGLPDAANALFVVGSFSCEHCRAELQRIDGLRKTSPRVRDLRVILVVREPPSAADNAGRRLPWLESLHVDERLWWSLIGSSPPSFVRIRPGESPPPPRDRWSY